jgi:hypothetical protein
VRQRIAAMPPSHDPSTDFAAGRRFLSVPIGVICGCCFITAGSMGAWERGGTGAWDRLVLVLVLVLETHHDDTTTQRRF